MGPALRIRLILARYLLISSVDGEDMERVPDGRVATAGLAIVLWRAPSRITWRVVREAGFEPAWARSLSRASESQGVHPGDAYNQFRHSLKRCSVFHVLLKEALVSLEYVAIWPLHLKVKELKRKTPQLGIRSKDSRITHRAAASN